MILDALLKVSAAQQITADAVSANVVDTGNVTPKRKIAVGEPMGFLVAISAVGTTSGSSKLTAVQSASATLGSGNEIIGELDIAAADHAVGACFIIPIAQGKTALRYVGLNYDITGTVDYTVDAYGPMPLSMLSVLAETYAKNYSI